MDELVETQRLLEVESNKNVGWQIGYFLTVPIVIIGLLGIGLLGICLSGIQKFDFFIVTFLLFLVATILFLIILLINRAIIMYHIRQAIKSSFSQQIINLNTVNENSEWLKNMFIWRRKEKH